MSQEGQLPSILAFYFTQQADEVSSGPRFRSCASKARANATAEMAQGVTRRLEQGLEAENSV